MECNFVFFKNCLVNTFGNKIEQSRPWVTVGAAAVIGNEERRPLRADRRARHRRDLPPTGARRLPPSSYLEPYRCARDEEAMRAWLRRPGCATLSVMKFGDFTATLVNGGNFRLDGGAMHGVVPKIIWNRLISCDDKNRCEYATNCLLVEGRGKRILIETSVRMPHVPVDRQGWGVVHPARAVARALDWPQRDTHVPW